MMLTAIMMFACQNVKAADNNGWPANYGGVMLQAFYWNSYSDTKWTNLTKNAQLLSENFDLIWIPQSGNCGGKSMGYDAKYWFPGGNHYTSAFGGENDLRTMIQTFKNLNVKVIGDVVINHRNTESGWFNFPSETYKNVTYQMTSRMFALPTTEVRLRYKQTKKANSSVIRKLLRTGTVIVTSTTPAPTYRSALRLILRCSLTTLVTPVSVTIW
jgi:hypothetical protein